MQGKESKKDGENKKGLREGKGEIRNKGGRNNVSRDVVFLLHVSGVKMQKPFLDYAPFLLSCVYWLP